MAVPIFLVINGYFFERITDNSMFWKWLNRITFLYIFWTLVYSYFWLQLGFYHILQSIFYGYFHLWYISGLIFSSFVVYKLRKLSTIKLLIIAALLYCVGCTLQYLSSYHLITLFDEFKTKKNMGLPTFVYRNFVFVCIPFMILGIQLKKHESWLKNFKYLNFFLFLSIVLLVLEASFNLAFSIKKSFDILFALFLVCPLIFLKFRQFEISFNSKMVGLLSSAIYFIHPLVYFTLFASATYQPTITVFATFGTSLLLSFLLIFLNKRIPIL